MKKYSVEIHVMASDEDEALNRAASAVAMGLVPHAVHELTSTPVQQELDLDSAVNAAFGGDGDVLPPTKKFSARRYTEKELAWVYDMVIAGKNDHEIGKATGRTSDAVHHITMLFKCDDARFAKVIKRYGPFIVNNIKALRKNRK